MARRELIDYMDSPTKQKQKINPEDMTKEQFLKLDELRRIQESRGTEGIGLGSQRLGRSLQAAADVQATAADLGMIREENVQKDTREYTQKGGGGVGYAPIPQPTDNIPAAPPEVEDFAGAGAEDVGGSGTEGALSGPGLGTDVATDLAKDLGMGGVGLTAAGLAAGMPSSMLGKALMTGAAQSLPFALAEAVNKLGGRAYSMQVEAPEVASKYGIEPGVLDNIAREEAPSLLGYGVRGARKIGADLAETLGWDNVSGFLDPGMTEMEETAAHMSAQMDREAAISKNLGYTTSYDIDYGSPAAQQAAIEEERMAQAERDQAQGSQDMANQFSTPGQFNTGMQQAPGGGGGSSGMGVGGTGEGSTGVGRGHADPASSGVGNRGNRGGYGGKGEGGMHGGHGAADGGRFAKGGLIRGDGDSKWEPRKITAHENEYVLTPEMVQALGLPRLERLRKKLNARRKK